MRKKTIEYEISTTLWNTDGVMVTNSIDRGVVTKLATDIRQRYCEFSSRLLQ